TDQPFLARGRLRRGLALAGNELRARNVFVPGVIAVHDFDVLIRLPIGALALDLRAPAGDLIVGLDVVLGQLAGLSVDLNCAAVSVVVERLDQLGLVPTAQHAHVPGPVEEDRLHVLGTCFGRERWTASAESAPARRSARSAASALRARRRGCWGLCPGGHT